MLNDITPNSGRTFFVRFKLHGLIAGLILGGMTGYV